MCVMLSYSWNSVWWVCTKTGPLWLTCLKCMHAMQIQQVGSFRYSQIGGHSTQPRPGLRIPIREMPGPFQPPSPRKSSLYDPHVAYCSLWSSSQFSASSSKLAMVCVSRLRRLRNGVPQGSTLSPTLFNIYISDIPQTTSMQYGYADDLALLVADDTWEKVEETLNHDMQAITNYLQKWRLILSTAKTTSTAFHLNNRDSQRQLAVSVNGTMLPNCEHPVYLGVTLDRTLTYKHHIEALRRKVNVRNGLLRCLAGSTWGAYTSTLRTGALALVYSAAEYASPVWSRSAHTGKLDVGLYDSMRIITGCMRPTETTFLPVLAGIVPPDIRRESQVARLTKMAMDNPSHLLHDRVSVAVTYANEHEQRLKSRRPFSRHAAHLVANNYDPPKAWNDRIDAGPPFIRSACPPPSPSLPPGADLPRKQWVRLNRLRSGTARVGETLQLWGMQEAASCPCGHPTQTVEHVVTDCVLLKSPGDLTALCCPNAETRSWLSELPIELWTLIFDYLVVVWQTLIYILLKLKSIESAQLPSKHFKYMQAMEIQKWSLWSSQMYMYIVFKG